MPFITTKDRAEIYFKDWGRGQPVVLSHGWPLNADAWDEQALFLARQGFRALAHDRRGHGRSTQTSDGNDMDTYADDLAMLFDKLDLKNVILVGHSTGGGEVARYLGRHGSKRVTKAVFVGAVTPHLIKSPDNPAGVPKEAFDDIRSNVAVNRAQYYSDFSAPFFGANRSGTRVSQGTRDAFWFQAMAGGLKPQLDCIAAFAETDFTDDLRKIDVPTLFIHGDDDQIVPIDASARRAVELVKGAQLKVYKGGPHALAVTHREQLNKDLLAFAKD